MLKVKHLLACLLIFTFALSTHAQKKPLPTVPTGGGPVISTMSSPAVNDIAFNQSTGLASVTVDTPANTTSQAVVIFVTAIHGTTSSPISITTPSGYTLAPAGLAQIGDMICTAAFYKVGDGVAVPVTLTASRACDFLWATVLVIDGADLASIIDDDDIDVIASSTGATAGPVTTTVANDLLLFFAGIRLYSFGSLQGPPSGMTAILSGVTQSVYPTPGIGIFLASGTQAAIGSSGAKGIATGSTSTSANYLLAIKPHPGPSIPAIVIPTAGLQVTLGAQLVITWTPSTSPTAAQSSLKYHIQYSDNNGVSWADVVSLTSAGVSSYTWDTTGRSLGYGYQIRIRAYDPAITTYSLDYGYSGFFSIVTETAPAAPTGLAPTTVQNKAVNVTTSYQAAGIIGNPVTASTWRWSRDNFASHDSGDIVVSSAAQSTAIDFSGEAIGATISYKVKRKGVSLYSPYSAVSQFVVANLPATPNITAPTAGSPPIVPKPTITFTEADAFVARRMRVIDNVSSELLYDVATSSTALSFTSLYHFAASVAVQLKLSVQNSYGLWSAEDSETFTPSYTPPAAPSITVTVVDAGGYIDVAFANSDTPSHNDLYRSFTVAGSTLTDADSETVVLEDADDPIRVGEGIAVDGSFRDYGAPSGREVSYYGQAVNSGTGMTTAGATEEATQNLEAMSLHAVTKESTTSNAALTPASLLNTNGQFISEHTLHSLPVAGREHPLHWFGQVTHNQGRYSVIVPRGDNAAYAALMAMFQAQSTYILCLRDRLGNRLFGYMSRPVVVDFPMHREINFEFMESSYSEAIT